MRANHRAIADCNTGKHYNTRPQPCPFPDRHRLGNTLLLVDFINLFDFDGAQKRAPRAIRAARFTVKLKNRARAAGMPCIYANDNFESVAGAYGENAQSRHTRGALGQDSSLEPVIATPAWSR